MYWYVIRTKPHQEYRAEFHLRQVSVETFLPLLKHPKRIRRQDKTIVEPLFPQYLFARFDMNDRYRAVNFASGVLNIVEFGTKPAEVGESVVEGIRARLVDGNVIPETEHFQQGQIVHVKAGPLAGLEAVFIRGLTKQHRVLLLMKALAFQANLTIDIDLVSGTAQGFNCQTTSPRPGIFPMATVAKRLHWLGF